VTVVTDEVYLARDGDLAGRCQAGDGDAFGELYALYHGRLVRHCAKRLGSHALAEDVAQEAFIRAWRAMDRFEVHRAFYPWLQVIASNACTDVLRHQRPTAPLTELVGAAEFDDGRGVEEQVTTAFDAALANGAMEQLSERHRRVLRLREQLDWSVQEIAEHEGLAANAVDTLLWRARASLRRRFRALSEGAAALVATGGTRLLSARHRIVHVVHNVDGGWGPTLRVRAAVAAAVVVGVGAASNPLAWSPATPMRPAPGVHHATAGTTVRAVGARPAAAGGRVGSPVVMPGRSVALSSIPSSGAPAGPTGIRPGALVQTPASPVIGGQPVGAVGSVPAAASTGAGAMQAVTATLSGVAGSVGGTVGGVLAETGGAVQSTLPIAALPPILPPITGGSNAAKGSTATGGTGSLIGLGAP